MLKLGSYMNKHTRTDSEKSISGKGITGNVGVFSDTSNNTFTFKKVAGSAFILLVLLVASIALFQAFVTGTPKCTEELLIPVRSSIDNNRPAQLNEIANNVKEIEGYKEDINCMFVVAKDNLKQGQVAEGIKSYEQVEALDEANNKFSAKLGSQEAVRKEAKGDLGFLKTLQNQLKANYFGVDEP